MYNSTPDRCQKAEERCRQQGCAKWSEIKPQLKGGEKCLGKIPVTPRPSLAGPMWPEFEEKWIGEIREEKKAPEETYLDMSCAQTKLSVVRRKWTKRYPAETKESECHRRHNEHASSTSCKTLPQVWTARLFVLGWFRNLFPFFTKSRTLFPKRI